MSVFIIGCGGVGSWLAPSLALLVGKDNVVLVDGDKLETKNLNRQLFSSRMVGANKADALGKLYGCRAVPEWYTLGSIDHNQNDWIICVVDNNPARVAALQACDLFGCRAILAANETHSAEAYIYLPNWKGTDRDPRKYYPELLTVKDGDPVTRGSGCTGKAQAENVQLVSANFMAAALAQHMFVLWAMEVPKSDEDISDVIPYQFRANLSKLENIKPIKKQDESILPRSITDVGVALQSTDTGSGPGTNEETAGVARGHEESATTHSV